MYMVITDIFELHWNFIIFPFSYHCDDIIKYYTIKSHVWYNMAFLCLTYYKRMLHVSYAKLLHLCGL